MAVSNSGRGWECTDVLVIPFHFVASFRLLKILNIFCEIVCKNVFAVNMCPLFKRQNGNVFDPNTCMREKDAVL